jgi:hypothetical protein
MLQLVGDEQSPGSITKPRKTWRRRKADARYAFAIQALKGGTGRTVAPASAGAEAGADEGDIGAAASEAGASETPPASPSGE